MRSTARSTTSMRSGIAARRSVSCSPPTATPTGHAGVIAIAGLERVDEKTHPDCKVFHAGTARDGDRIVVTGGRVLCVTALGDSVKQAQRAAYAAIADIHFDGMQYRTDIGHRAVSARRA